MTIRNAQPEDMEPVARLLSESFRPALRMYMTYTQAGAEAFMGAFVENPRMAADRCFLIAESPGGALEGFAEFRTPDPATAFLVYICVSPDAQGRGLARRLIERFLQDHASIREIRLDVFEDNHRALGLYRRLGFVEESRVSWLVRPLPPGGADPAITVPDLPFARAAFARYGFCEMTVVRGEQTTRIGRIGDWVVRCFTVADFEDDGLLSDIAAVIPEAGQALLIAPDVEIGSTRDAGDKINGSIRMRWNIDGLDTMNASKT